MKEEVQKECKCGITAGTDNEGGYQPYRGHYENCPILEKVQGTINIGSSNKKEVKELKG